MSDNFYNDQKFVDHVEALKPKLQFLLAMVPVSPKDFSPTLLNKGVYLFSENERHLYVGRSNNIRRRIARHLGTYTTASFAFRLARETTGNIRATYRKGRDSRRDLVKNQAFVSAFEDAKNRIRRMELRFVDEADPVRQGLLEIYVAVVLQTPHNDFNTY